MLWLWILLGILAVPVTLYLALIVFLYLYYGPDSADTPFILEQGQEVKCWIVMAIDQLYKGLKPGQSESCHVVFTTTPGVPDLDDRLKALAESLHAFDPGENPSKDERITSQVMKTQIGYSYPLRLPPRVAGELEAYNISVRIPYELLPEGKLSRPYIFCKVLLEGEHCGARMVEYPAGEAE